MNKKVKLLILAAIVIIFGFILNFLLASYILPADKALTYHWEFPTNSAIYTTMFVSKEWDDSVDTVGAQYDWVICNTTKNDVEKWTVSFELPEDTYIDSIWNVDYRIVGTTVELTPLNYDDVIKAGSDQTFGMILIGKDEFAPGPVNIGYSVIYSATSLPLFPIMCFLSFLWALFLVQILSEERIRRQERARKQQDKETIIQSMSTFINFIDAKDPYTKGHSQRVATIAAELGKRMGLDSEITSHLYYAGILHDSGKIGIPDNILKKVGILSSDEYYVIQQHAIIGGHMLEGFTAINGIREAAMYHHERYDGNGYPEGLKGDNIPLFGRIICVADTYDAMARDRCYRKHLSKEKMLQEFKDNSGTQFDPDIVKIMIAMVEDGTAEKLTAKL